MPKNRKEEAAMVAKMIGKTYDEVNSNLDAYIAMLEDELEKAGKE